MFTVILLSLIGCDNSMLDSAAMASCEDGVDDDGDGFVDLEDPDCFEDGSGEEMDYQGPVEGLGLLSATDVRTGQRARYFDWTGSAGWPSSVELTLIHDEGEQYHEETHPWADILLPLALEYDVPNDEWIPGVATAFGSITRWELCAGHPDAPGDEVCVEGGPNDIGEYPLPD